MSEENQTKPFSAENMLFYAPIGVFFTLKDMMPTVLNMLSDRGRDQVTKAQNSVNNTYVLAKSMGQLRVNQAQQEGKKRADQMRDAASGGLRVVQGVGRQAQETAQGAATTATKTASTAAKQAQTVIGSGAGAVGGAQGTNGSGSAASATGPGLAIPDYDTLSAMNVAERLDTLSKPELEAIRDYEESHKARKTVLGKIDSLLAS